MPFTLAHPAAVLPWHRSRQLPLLVLAAGSVAPDLPYFVPASIGRHFPNGHQPFGAAFVSPVLALMLVAALLLLREPLLQMLWGRHRVLVAELLAPNREGRAAGLRWAAALYLGVATHLAWDSFTHGYGWPVQHWSWLRMPVLQLGARTVLMFTAAQWLSSVLGVCVLVLWYRMRLREIPATLDSQAGRIGRRRAVMVVAVLALGYGLLQAVHPGPLHSSVHDRVYLASTAATASFLLGWCAIGVLLVLRRRARQQHTRP